MATVAVLDYFLTLDDEVRDWQRSILGDVDVSVRRSTTYGRDKSRGRFMRSFWSVKASIYSRLWAQLIRLNGLQNRYSLLLFVLWQQIG